MTGARRLVASPLSRRLLRDALSIAGIVIVLFVWWLITFNDYQHDARAYWAAGLEDPYARARVGGSDAYLYSPAFAQLIAPLGWLPLEVFRGVWAALNLGALVWLAGPLIGGLSLVLPGSPVIDEVGTGNIHLLIAAAIYASLRWPAAWGFLLLTKVTPGVGVAYLLGARKWRAFGVALAATAAISLASFIAAPHLWFEWVSVLSSNTQVIVPDEIAIIPGDLILRTIVALALAIAAGLKGWLWAIPVSATLALPVPWSSGLSVLAAVVALWRTGQLVERPAQPRRGDTAAP